MLFLFLFIYKNRDSFNGLRITAARTFERNLSRVREYLTRVLYDRFFVLSFCSEHSFDVYSTTQYNVRAPGILYDSEFS